MLDAVTQFIKTAAREELLPRFADIKRSFKSDGSIVTEADLAVQNRLTKELTAFAPAYHVLGEEMTEQDQLGLIESGDMGFWCLDPLDGTSNFAAGIPFFTVSLALVLHREPVLGIIYDPIRDECFTAIKRQGAWLNEKPLHCKPAGLPLSRAMAVVDLKRLGNLASRLVTSPPYSSQRNFGSVTLQWCWLAANRYHVYLHGRQKLWDYAAGALILREAGGFSETLDGEVILNHDLQPHSAMAASDPELFIAWKDWLNSQPAGNPA